MPSRRTFLATVTGAVAGLAGCQFGSDAPENVSETDDVRTTPSPSPSGQQEPVNGTKTPPGTETPGGAGDQQTDEMEQTPTPDQLADRFETIYDVTDKGADPTGAEPIDDVIHRLVADDTLLRFPSGTYLVDEMWTKEVSNFGLVGPDATFKPITRGRNIFLNIRQVSDLLVDGFTVDNTAKNTAAWCDLKCTGGTNVFRNYTVEGFDDVSKRTNGFTIMVQGGDTSLELANVDLSQGAEHAAATFVFPRRDFYDPNQKAGSLTFRNCVMKGWGKEGLYASAHEGPLKVIGGEYANNAIVQVRVGGGHATNEALVRDVTVRVDDIPEYVSDYAIRGIWLKEGDNATIENCDVKLTNLGYDRTPGGVVVYEQFGRATIRDCTITMEDVPRPAILVEEPIDEYSPKWMPSLDRLPREWDVTVENVTLNGRSRNSESIRIESRNGCTIRDVTANIAGQAADGLGLHNGVNECTLTGGSLNAQRFPVYIEYESDYAGSENCLLTVSQTTLSGTDMRDTELDGNGDRTYCVGSNSLQGSAQYAGNLALTRTVGTSATESPETTQTNSQNYQLYGTWISD